MTVLRDETLDYFAFVIDGVPEMHHLATYLHVHLVEVPAPVAEATRAANPLPANIASKHRFEPVPLHAHGLMTDVEAALEEQILDVPR